VPRLIPERVRSDKSIYDCTLLRLLPGYQGQLHNSLREYISRKRFAFLGEDVKNAPRIAAALKTLVDLSEHAPADSRSAGDGEKAV